ncbi:patatin-like phospholipase family protein, partial [Sulfurivirga sp.]|uniref:patatin-like phospholipase family protein n=1 Tax=Sulfurivirga sp. TaxID=2614236 RepID=UPI0025FF9606
MAEKIALALGGGGARGLAHFGVMEYLSERKVQVTAVAGTSMGAIAGAAIAAGDWRRLAEGYARLDWMKLLPMMDITLS